MFSPDAFSTDFELQAADEPQPEPAPDTEDQYPEDGPWVSHGVVHLAKPPSNH